MCGCTLFLSPDNCSQDDDCDDEGLICVDQICVLPAGDASDVEVERDTDVDVDVDVDVDLERDADDGEVRSDGTTPRDGASDRATSPDRDSRPPRDGEPDRGDADALASPHDATKRDAAIPDAHPDIHVPRPPVCQFVLPTPEQVHATNARAMVVEVAVVDEDTAPEHIRATLDGERIELNDDHHYVLGNYRLGEEGLQSIRLNAIDDAGKTCAARASVLVDRTAPIFHLLDPFGGATTTNRTVYTVVARVDEVDENVGFTVTLRGEPVIAEHIRWDAATRRVSIDAEVVAGPNQLQIMGFDRAGNVSPERTTVVITYDPGIPGVEIFEPPAEAVLSEQAIVVVGSVEDDTPLARIFVEVAVDSGAGPADSGDSIDPDLGPIDADAGEAPRATFGPFGLDASGQFSALVQLFPGDNTIRACARDPGGNEGCAQTRVHVDLSLQAIEILDPLPDALVDGPSVTVEGRLSRTTESVRVSLGEIEFETEAELDRARLRWSSQVELPRAGPHTIFARGIDSMGDIEIDTVQVYWDTTPPDLDISRPESGTCISGHEITVCGRATDDETPVLSVRINGWPAQVLPDGRFCVDVRLPEGEDRPISAITMNAGGLEREHVVVVSVDQTDPEIQLELPEIEQYARVDPGGRIRVEGSVSDVGCGVATGTLTLDGRPALLDRDRRFSDVVVRPAGPAVVQLAVADEAGNTTVLDAEFTVDLTRPTIQDVEPPAWIATRAEYLWVSATVLDHESGLASATIGNVEVQPDEDGFIQRELFLREGRVEVDIVVRDQAGWTAESAVVIHRDRRGPTLLIDYPRPGAHVPSPVTVRGSFDDGPRSSGVVSLRVNDRDAIIDPGEQPGVRTWSIEDVDLPSGVSSISVTAIDAAGNPGRPRTIDVVVSDFAPDNAEHNGLSGSTDVGWVGVADVDHDGRLDIVALPDRSTARPALFLQGEHHDFERASEARAGLPTDLAAVEGVMGDFDADGQIDLAYGGVGHNGMLLGAADGRFAAVPASGISTTARTRWLSGGDANHDGRADLLLVAGNRTRLMIGRGDGTFVSQGLQDAGLVGLSDMYEARLVDLDGDQLLDVVAVGPSGSAMWRGEAQGGFRLAPAEESGFESLPGEHFTLLDADVDGDLDVLAFGRQADAPRPNGGAPRQPSVDVVRLHLNPKAQGSGARWSTSEVAISPPVGLAGCAAADLNGDGHDDVVLYGEGGLEVWVSLRGQYFQLNNSRAGLPDLSDVQSVQLVDIDADGDVDIVAGSRAGVTLTRSNAAVTLAPLPVARLRIRRGRSSVLGPADALGVVVYVRALGSPSFGRALLTPSAAPLAVSLGVANSADLAVRFVDVGEPGGAQRYLTNVQSGEVLDVFGPLQPGPPVTIEPGPDVGVGVDPVPDVAIPDVVVPDVVVPDVGVAVEEPGVAEVGVADVGRPEVSDGPDVGTSDVRDVGVSDLADMRPPDVLDMEVPDVRDVEVPDVPDVEVPDVPDVEVPDVPDVVPPDVTPPVDMLPEDVIDAAPDMGPPDASFDPPVGDQGERRNLITFTRGQRISLISGRIRVGREGEGGEIWVIDPDDPGSGRQVISSERGGNLMSAWSPDKRWLVFASNRGREFTDADPTPVLDLWVADLQGANTRRLTASPGHDWTPAWSPNGRLVAYASTVLAPDSFSIDEASSLDIWVVNADGTRPRLLYAGPDQDEDPVFGPDNRTVYFPSVQRRAECGSLQVWQVDVERGPDSAGPLLDGEGRVVCGEDLSISADGSNLYLVDDRNFFRFDFATGVLTMIEDNRTEPWISPNQDRYTFVNGDLAIEVSDLDGVIRNPITLPGFIDFFPRWTP